MQTAVAGVANATAPLPHVDRIQAAFGAHDVRHVRAMVGGDGASAATAIGARAYTVGDRVAFRSQPDLRLAAHEAAHVVQQRAGVALDDGVGHAGDSFEQHADQVAEAVVAGRSAEAMLGAPVASSTQPDRVQMACACGTCAACVQRAPDDTAPLASTPGGLRLGELDPTTVQDTVDKILTDVQNFDLYRVQQEYVALHPPPQQIDAQATVNTPDLYNAIHDTASDVDNYVRDATLKADTKTALFTDIAVVFARAFRNTKLDVPGITRDIASLSTTYRQLVHIYANDNLDPIRAVPPAIPLDDQLAFQERAKVFYSFAKDKLGPASPALVRVQQGLAADLGRLLDAQLVSIDGKKLIAPDRGAELLVFQLLQDPPMLGDLVALFKQVVEAVYRRLSGQHGQLVYLLANSYANEMIAAPIDQKLKDAAAKGPPQREKVRRELAILLGQYLARLGPDSAYYVTGSFMYVMQATYGAAMPTDLARQVEAAQQEYDAIAATPAPAAPAPRPATPPVPQNPCPIEIYDTAYLGRWLRAYFTNRTAFRRWKFDAEELLCQFHPAGHAKDEVAHVKTNIADFRDLAEAFLGQLDRQQKTARMRFVSIDKQRRALGATSVAETPPDYVAWFRLDELMRGLLPLVANITPFDDAGTIEKLSELFLPHFIALNKYQKAIADALDLIARARKDQTDVYLRTQYRDTHGHDFDELTSLALTVPRWPFDDRTLHSGDGLALRVSMMTTVVDQAIADRETYRRQAMEQEVFAAVQRYINTRHQLHLDLHTDIYTPWQIEQMWSGIRGALTTLQKPGDEKLARTYLTSALDQLAHERFEQLQVGVQAAAGQRDTLRALEFAKRLDALSKALFGKPQTGTLDDVIKFARGEASNLIAVYAMAQGVIAMDTNESTPGEVVRETNLLKFMIDEMGAKSLTEAVNMLDDEVTWGQVQSKLLDSAGYKNLIKDSDKGFFDSFELSAMGALLPMGARNDLLRSADKKDGVLRMLLDVEQAGGGEHRKRALYNLGKRLESQASLLRGASGMYAVAAMIYSLVLDAPTELQDPDQTARDKEEEDKKQGIDPIPFLSGWVDESLAKDDRNAFVKKLQDKDDNAQLSPAEHLAFTAWKEIKGTAHWYSMGKEGWAHFVDWAKNLIKMAIVAYVTGGIGELASGAVGFGEFATFTTKVLLFTEGMRGLNELSTLQRSQTGFWEDFAVNFAMMGLGGLAQEGAARFFALRGVTGLKAAAGVFAAEYATFTGIGITHLTIRAAVTGDVITGSDLRSQLLDNLATLVAFRGAAALGKGASKLLGLKAPMNLKPEHVHALEVFDQQIEDYAQQAASAKTPEEAMEKLDQQAEVLRNKAKILKDSGDPYLEQLGDEFLKGVDLYDGDRAKARLTTRIKAIAVPGTPNFTYELGGANEQALEQHFLDQGYKVKTTKTLDGTIYDVETPDGPMRFSPRRPALASERSTYSPVGRLAGEKMIESVDDLMGELKADNAADKDVRDAKANDVKLTTPDGTCAVTILPVDAHTVTGLHEAGPAVSHRPQMNPDGTWTLTVEVLRNTSHDQIVRSVNHELREMRRFMAAGARDATTAVEPITRYLDPPKLDALIAKESAASAKTAGPGSPLTSHDYAKLGELATLQKQWAALTARSTQGMSPEDAVLLEQRKALMQQDMQLAFADAGLPIEREAFDRRIADLQEQALAAGEPLDDQTISMARQLRIARERGTSDLAPQIVLNELAKVMTRKMYEPSLVSFQRYIDNAVLAKATTVFNDEISAGSDKATALAAAVRIVELGIGGLRVASMRGFAFEGLAVERLNRTPEFVRQYGRVSALPAGTPTFDAAAIKNVAGVSAAGAVGELQSALESSHSPDGRPVRLLRIYDDNGDVYRQEPEGTVWQRPDVEVFFLSFKAKSAYSPQATIEEMVKAIGTPSDATGHTLLGTAEYGKGVDAIVADARDALAKADQAVADRKPGAKRQRLRARQTLDLKKFLQDRSMTLDDIQNADLDALIETMRAEGYDPRTLIDALLHGGPTAALLGDVEYTRVNVWMTEAEAAAWQGAYEVPPAAMKALSSVVVVPDGAPRPKGTGPVLVTFEVPNVSLNRSTSVWQLRPDGTHSRIIIRGIEIRGRK